MNVFCFPYVGASCSIYGPWKKLINNAQMILVDFPGHGPKYKSKLLTEIVQIADEIYLELKSKFEEPYILYAHSMGSLVCYELIKCLIKNNDSLPKHFILSGHRAPHIKRSEQRMQDLSDEDFIVKFQECYGSLPRELFEDMGMKQMFLPIIKADTKAIENYAYKEPRTIIPCPITAIYGKNDVHAMKEEVKEWSLYTNDFNIIEVVDDHYSMLKSELIPKMINEIANQIPKNQV